MCLFIKLFYIIECPSIYTTQYDPVCGSDGFTYSNGYNLEVKKCIDIPDLQVAYKGECWAIQCWAIQDWLTPAKCPHCEQCSKKIDGNSASSIGLHIFGWVFGCFAVLVGASVAFYCYRKKKAAIPDYLTDITEMGPATTQLR